MTRSLVGTAGGAFYFSVPPAEPKHKEIRNERAAQARIFHPALTSAGAPLRGRLREDREAVVLADRLGYREAFIGEHLVDS